MDDLFYFFERKRERGRGRKKKEENETKSERSDPMRVKFRGIGSFIWLVIILRQKQQQVACVQTSSG